MRLIPSPLRRAVGTSVSAVPPLLIGPMSSPRHNTLQIRAARVQDLSDLLTLEQRVNGAEGLSRRSFKRFLAGTGAAMLVAVRNKTIAG